MKNTFIVKNISRCNRNCLLTNLLFTIFVLIIAKFVYVDIYNIFMGPFTLDSNLLLEKPGSILKYKHVESEVGLYRGGGPISRYLLNNKYYFKLDTENSIKLDVDEYKIIRFEGSVKEKEYLVGEFIAVKIKDKYLIIKIKNGIYKDSYKGFIMPLSNLEATSILGYSNKKVSIDQLVPYWFDASTGSISLNIYIKSTLFLLLLGLNIFFYIRFALRTINYRKHPIYDRLTVYGEADEIIMGMQKELDDLSSTKKSNVATTLWTFKKTLYNLKIERNYVAPSQEPNGMAYVRKRN